MNKKGMSNVATIVMLFMGIVVAIALLLASAQEKSVMTDTQAFANVSLGTMSNATILNVTNCRALSDVAIFNATNDVEIPADNYTLTNNVVFNSQAQVSITPSVIVSAGYNVGTATIDGTCQPLTYLTGSADRSIANLIITLSAIALIVWVAWASGILERFK